MQQCASKRSSSSSDIQNYFKVCTSKLSVTGCRSKELPKGLMTFIINDLKPISLVEGEGFHEFMHIALPEYIVPCRKTTTRQIYQMAIVERENLKVVLKDISSVCLTVDFWTAVSNNTYLGVICHFWIIENYEIEFWKHLRYRNRILRKILPII